MWTALRRDRLEWDCLELNWCSDAKGEALPRRNRQKSFETVA